MNQQIFDTIKNLADKFALKLENKVKERMNEMLQDDTSHYLIYKVLGISANEGKLIDDYQNKGRFVYKYAGAFLEEATILCIKYKYPNAKKIKIKNTFSTKPKTYEIDCLVGNDAYEIKWKEATTDGDHITKEHSRIKTIKEQGYNPIRIMFYYPQRNQAQKIQETLKTLYNGIGGKYYCGNDAWEYIHQYTGINLLQILESITKSRGV